MVNVNIATGAEQPINRHGATAGEEMQEGDLVGIDAEGEMVQATADSAGPVMALGVALTPADDLANYTEVATRLTVESERALIGRDRVSAISNGVEVENGDRDWGFTPGEPVYLAPGGGFTQTEPSAVGDLIQVVGEATDDGEALFLDVETGYEVVA